MRIYMGTTRVTFVIWIYAFKIPIVTRTLKHFIKGWLGNIDERHIWKNLPKRQKYKLCPTYVSIFGLVNIMPRATKVTNGRFDKQWALNFFNDDNFDVDVCSGWKNFGYIKGIRNPVLLDYAHQRESTEYCTSCAHDCILRKKPNP